MTKNNTVTKIDIRLDGVFLLKKKRVFLELPESIALALTENIFVTGFADHHFY